MLNMLNMLLLLTHLSVCVFFCQFIMDTPNIHFFNSLSYQIIRFYDNDYLYDNFSLFTCVCVCIHFNFIFQCKKDKCSLLSVLST